MFCKSNLYFCNLIIDIYFNCIRTTKCVLSCSGMFADITALQKLIRVSSNT